MALSAGTNGTTAITTVREIQRHRAPTADSKKGHPKGCPFLYAEMCLFCVFPGCRFAGSPFYCTVYSKKVMEDQPKQEGCYEMAETEIVYEVEEGAVKAEGMNGRRKWKLAGKTAVRRYARLVDALIDFVETGDGLRGKLLSSVFGSEPKPRMFGYGVVVRVAAYRYADGAGVRVGTPKTLHFRRYTVDDWKLEQRERR